MTNRPGNALRTHAVPIALLTVLWVVLVFVVNPAGSFPLNDDWNYARTVKSLLEEHKLIVTQWSLAASVPHILVGCLACLPCGFSFEALRGSTIVLGWIVILAAYFLCIRINGERRLAAFVAVLLCVNPLFFNLSLTFMTDVPFLALAALSLLLLAPLYQQKSVTMSSVIFATLIVALTCLLRQTGLVIPVAFAFTRWQVFRNRTDSQKITAGTSGSGDQTSISGDGKSNDESDEQSVNSKSAKSGVSGRFGSISNPAIIALAPLAASLICVAAFQSWLSNAVGTLYSYRVEQLFLQQHFAKGATFVMMDTMQNVIIAFVYLGLFALPLMPLVFRPFLSILNKSERFLLVGLGVEVSVLFGMGLLYTNSVMPLVDNVFFNFGVGPLLLGLSSAAGQSWPAAPRFAMQILELVGSAGAGFLTVILGFVSMRCVKRKPFLLDPAAGNLISLCLVALVLYIAVICVRGFFDRYLLFPFLLLLPIIASSPLFLRIPVSGVSLNKSDSTSTAETLSANPSDAIGALRDSGAAAANNRFAPAAWVAAGLLALPLAYVAVSGTHDYLSWNRARWQALNQLTDAQSISAMDIDGGLEFNGWSGYDLRYRDKGGIVLDGSMRHKDAYAVTLVPMPGFEVLRRYSFQRWLPVGTGELLVLKKLGTAVHPH